MREEKILKIVLLCIVLLALTLPVSALNRVFNLKSRGHAPAIAAGIAVLVLLLAGGAVDDGGLGCASVHAEAGV